ncbi:hypothetical protein BC828DRAFT_436706 [Blastocladiella britannica]|nr:hypothetical protein BC828DRAFT_436706 [Blastocladiella britannica]
MALNPGQPPALPLWTGRLALTLRSGAADQRSASAMCDVTLTVRREPRRTLELSLTQESDPYFLYTLVLSEEDYHLLKADQGFVVDFGVFPDKVIELLAACGATPLTAFPAHPGPAAPVPVGQPPKCTAQLLVDGGLRPSTLQIVETNTFKQIIHLSLLVVPGNDTAVKKYLASVVAQLKDQLATARAAESQSASSYRLQLDDAHQTIATLRSEMDAQRTKHTTELRQLTTAHSEELNAERVQVMQERDRERRAHAQQLRDTESRLEDQLQAMALQHTTTAHAHDEAAARVRSLERELAQVRESLDRLDRAHADLQATHSRLVAEKSSVERDLMRAQEESVRAREQSAAAEARDRDRAELLAARDRELARESERRGAAQATVEQLQAQVASLEASVKESVAEIHKGNDIISKLQAEVKSVKSKLKLKNMVTLQQEKTLDDQAGKLAQVQVEADEAKRKLGDLEARAVRNEGEASKWRTEADELRKKMEEQQTTIGWLHKRLNEDLMRDGPGMFEDPVLAPYSGGGGLGGVAPAAAAGTYRTLSPIRSATAARIMESVHRSVSPAKRTGPPPRASMIPVPVSGATSAYGSQPGPGPEEGRRSRPSFPGGPTATSNGGGSASLSSGMARAYGGGGGNSGPPLARTGSATAASTAPPPPPPLLPPQQQSSRPRATNFF